MAGKRIENDIRNQLVFSYIKFIRYVRPKMILFENVKGFKYAFDKNKNSDAEPYSKKVIRELENLYYNVKDFVIDFSKYGVPQRRKRFILVGIQDTIGTPYNFVKILEANKDRFLASKGLSEQSSSITTAELSKILKVNSRTIQRDFAKLLDKGILIREGSDKSEERNIKKL